MAPIPKDMATWSPHLFKLLTESFFEEEVFKKSTSDTSYTCSNIPVLVAVLVHLEDKGIICCGNTLTKEVKPLFHSAGLYQDTRHWLEDGWPDLTDGITETWANTLQTTFRVTVGQKGGAQELELPQIIKMLLYGTYKEVDGTVSPTSKSLREKTNEAIQGLTMSKLRKMLMDPNSMSASTAAAALVARDAADGEAPPDRLPNPFLNKKEMTQIMGDEESSPEDIQHRMEILRKDHLAKAMNLSIHIAIHNADSEEQDEFVIPEGEASKNPDWGRLKFLTKPKPPIAVAGKKGKKGKKGNTDSGEGSDGTAEVAEKPVKDQPTPVLFQEVRAFADGMDQLCSRKANYEAKPTEIWEELKKLSSIDWLGYQQESSLVVDGSKIQPAVAKRQDSIFDDDSSLGDDFASGPKQQTVAQGSSVLQDNITSPSSITPPSQLDNDQATPNKPGTGSTGATTPLATKTTEPKAPPSITRLASKRKREEKEKEAAEKAAATAAATQSGSEEEAPSTAQSPGNQLSTGLKIGKKKKGKK